MRDFKLRSLKMSLRVFKSSFDVSKRLRTGRTSPISGMHIMLTHLSLSLSLSYRYVIDDDDGDDDRLVCDSITLVTKDTRSKKKIRREKR